MKPLTLIAMLLLFVGTSVHAQVTNAEAEDYFGQFMDRSEQAVEFESVIATKKELKKVFSRKDAKRVNALYEEKLAEKKKDPGSKVYAQVRIVNFSSEELKNGTEKAAGGMRKISPRVKPGIVFYQVTYYKRADAKLGLSYKYFCHIKDKWVFLPKPWQAFR